MPDTSRCVPPQVYNAIGDHARQVNRPEHCPGGEPYMPPEEEAPLAEWLGEGQADPGPTEEQIIGWNEANGHETDLEAGT